MRTIDAAADPNSYLRGAPFSSIRDDFPITKNRTYLNNGRWHPMSLRAMRAVQDYLELKLHGSERPNSPICEEMELDVKTRFAGLVNARVSEISFVPSTLAAENLVLASLGIPGSKGNIVTDALHFDGSLYMYRCLERRGFDIRIVQPTPECRIDIRDMERAIDRNTILVAISLVSYLNGFQHDLKTLCELAHSGGALVYADIIQAAGAIPIDVRSSAVDFCACSSFKWLMGDFGLGFLYVREDLLDGRIRPTQYGYRQIPEYFQAHGFSNDRLSAITADRKRVADAAGFFEVGTISETTVACLSHSLKFIHEFGVANIQAHVQSLIQRLRKEVPSLGFEPLTPPEAKSPIVSFALKDPKPVAGRVYEENIDIMISADRMRISPSIYNDQTDIDRLLNALDARH